MNISIFVLIGIGFLVWAFVDDYSKKKAKELVRHVTYDEMMRTPEAIAFTQLMESRQAPGFDEDSLTDKQREEHERIVQGMLDKDHEWYRLNERVQ